MHNKPIRKCIIVGSGDFSGFREKLTADFVIAADGGYDKLTRYGIIPDLIIGDFDSIKNCDIPNNIEIIRFPSEKDASDLELAIKEAINRGFNCFYIYGALGGRLDHTLASIAVLVSISRKGLTGWLIGENEIITSITDDKITLDSPESRIISIFPSGEQASGVCLKGLKYTLDNATLTCYTSHGLSNEFIDEKAVIEVQDGTLIVVVNS